jgi:uncharacterized protein (TIGR03437 family)
VSAGETAQLSAALGQSTQTLVLRVRGQDTISSLACNPPALVGGGTLTCTVELAQAAPAGGTAVTLQAASSRVQVPRQVLIPAGAKSSQFAARVLVSDRDEESSLTAVVEGVLRTTKVLLTGLRPTGLVCFPLAVQAGESFTCEVRMNSSEAPEVARLEVAGDSEYLKLPRTIITRPRQSRLSFKVFTDARAKEGPVAVQVVFGSASAFNLVILKAAAGPVLSVPKTRFAKFGKAVEFTVSASDANELPVALAATNVPQGASFDAETGRFFWTPEEAHAGTYDVAFTATNAANQSATGLVTIFVDSGKPVVTRLVNGATQADGAVCSPGGVASLVGRWLVAGGDAVSGPSGSLMELAGTRVKVNGEYAPVLSGSIERVDFLCPDLAPGTPLSVSLESEAGVAEPLDTVMQDVAPGIFTVDGSGQGQGSVFLAGTSLLAISRNFRVSGQPAQPGDSISLRAAGLGAAANVASLAVKIGDIVIQPDSVEIITGSAGIYEITVKVPAGTAEGDAVPVSLLSVAPDGRVVESNGVTIAIEAPRE